VASGKADDKFFRNVPKDVENTFAPVFAPRKNKNRKKGNEGKE